MNKYNLFFATLLFVLVSTTTYAQANPPADGTGDGVPVDGGLTALLVGGAIYGAKKLKERKK
ncbi:PID-CTERM protein-sorting domain-containing protein [Flavobacterium sp.]|jgi:hypothetical protein|uniref:PID-CTERM protein-sorting domain-containing protein n=1 Tax=Flavobacterium sp. TaxID=239 RepID=UPI0025CEE96D|nr:hypothetical protein [Flavobacterium sp.]